MGNIFAFIQDPDGKLWKLNFKSIRADSSTSSKLNLTYVIMTHAQDSSTKWSKALPIRGMPTRSASAARKPLTRWSGLDCCTRNHTCTCTQCASMGYLVNQDINSISAFARGTDEFLQSHRQDHFYSVLYLKGFAPVCYALLNFMLAHHLSTAQRCFPCQVFLKILSLCEPMSSGRETSGCAQSAQQHLSGLWEEKELRKRVSRPLVLYW